MESDIKIRFKDLLSYLKMGQGQFEEKCRLSNGTINNIKKSVTSVNIERIMNVFPEVNIEWLISGKGKMIKEKNEDQISKLTELEYWKSMAKSAQEMYEDEVKKVVRLRLEIISLKAKLEEKQKTA